MDSHSDKSKSLSEPAYKKRQSSYQKAMSDNSTISETVNQKNIKNSKNKEKKEAVSKDEKKKKESKDIPAEPKLGVKNQLLRSNPRVPEGDQKHIKDLHHPLKRKMPQLHKKELINQEESRSLTNRRQEAARRVRIAKELAYPHSQLQLMLSMLL